MIQPLVGVWLLTASFCDEAEMPYLSNNRRDPHGVDNWLYGSSHEQLTRAMPAEGLTLHIESDSTFTERRHGQPNVPWFDAEGVLDTDVTPFDGLVRMEGRTGYLLLATPIRWAIPRDRVRKTRIRYEDGDTTICDKVELVDGRLVRTVSVVTDELYLERNVLVYRRSGT